MSRRALLPALLVLAAAVWWFALREEPGAQRAHTIVLITPDTLRWDHVSAYGIEGGGPPHPRTPRMDRLAAGGLRFSDARTPVPLTLPAHVTMLAGLPPAATGVRLNTYGRLPSPAQRGFPLLPERLAEQGYHTAAFVSAAVLGARYGLDDAFGHYDDGALGHAGTVTVQERRGGATVAAALAHVRTRPVGEPLFLWVHLFEPHAPYAADGSYAGDVEDVDAIVGALLDGLAAAGRGEAAVLLTSDHGEALGELQERTHGLLLADGVLRVPFVLGAPGLEPGVREDPADLADVAPTLAALAGLPWPARDVPGAGRDLLDGPSPSERVRVAETVYGHQLHRWAQLVAARGPTGTLVDVGADRLRWIPPSDRHHVRAGTELPPGGPATRRLANSIAEYKDAERADRIQQGQVAAGYGGAGVVEGFLPAAENARLPDPYNSILAHHRLDQIKAQLLRREQLGPAGARRLLEALEALQRPSLLAGSPELSFWVGMAHEILAGLGVPGHAAQAETAYLEAFRLGRKDTDTLVRACGVNAHGREAECLERLETLGRQVPSLGPKYETLRQRLRAGR
jgi:hypothetical protein